MRRLRMASTCRGTRKRTRWTISLGALWRGWRSGSMRRARNRSGGCPSGDKTGWKPPCAIGRNGSTGRLRRLQRPIRVGCSMGWGLPMRNDGLTSPNRTAVSSQLDNSLDLLCRDQEDHPPGRHNPNRLHGMVLVKAIKRLNEFCGEDIQRSNNLLLVLDEHDQRSALITEASRSMCGGQEPRRHLIEPPFQAESHRYQTLQAADWVAGIVGRLGAFWADLDAFPENQLFRRYFGQRLNDVQIRSGLRS